MAILWGIITISIICYASNLYAALKFVVNCAVSVNVLDIYIIYIFFW